MDENPSDVQLDGSLQGDMQRFGPAHEDSEDALAGISSMLVLSDVPSSYERGRINFIASGFFAEQEPFDVIFFSGHKLHGGTAPIAPEGEEAEDWAYRCVLIGYPPGPIQEGDVRHTLAALPYDGQPLYITQEMTGVQ